MSDALKLASPWTEDRSRGLRISGGILIALGVACLGFTALMLLGNAFNPKQRWEPAIFYAVSAAIFFALGFGSYMGRRWARDLILVCSVYSLATMLLAMPFGIWTVSRFFAANTRHFGDDGSLGCVVTMTLVVMFLVLVALPLGFLLFFARKDVRTTVERLDPERRWTQAQPLPVIGAVLVYASAAVGTLAALIDPILPVPGGMLTGAAARVWLLATCVMTAAVGWGLYRGKRGAWIAAIALTAAWIAISILGLRDLDFAQLQRAMGASEEEQKLMANVDIVPGLVAMVASGGVVWLGYLWWLRKYFQAPRTAAS